MFIQREKGNVFNGYTVFVLYCWPMPHTSKGDESVAGQATMKSQRVLWVDLTQQRLFSKSQFIGIITTLRLNSAIKM